MNKKIFLAVFLILATMIVSAFPVYAGKGTTKVEFVMTFVDQSLNFFEPPVVTGQNRHASIWYNLGDIGIVTLTIDQGAEVYYGYGAHYPDGEPTTISPVSDFEYYSEMEVEVHQVNDEEKDFGNLHWWYTLDFGDGNVITVKCNGKNYRTTPTTSWGNIVGFGTGIFENIQLKGTAGNDETGIITHWGTIMGWPTITS